MPTVPKTEANMKNCVCPTCPTYTADNCAKEKGEVLYCAVGKSGCNPMERGCICGICPVWDEYKLVKNYFCLHGEAV